MHVAEYPNPTAAADVIAKRNDLTRIREFHLLERGHGLQA